MPQELHTTALYKLAYTTKLPSLLKIRDSNINPEFGLHAEQGRSLGQVAGELYRSCEVLGNEGSLWLLNEVLSGIYHDLAYLPVALPCSNAC